MPWPGAAVGVLVVLAMVVASVPEPGEKNDTTYIYGAGLVSEKIGNTRYYYVKDHTGSVANVLSASGTGSAISKIAYTYDPWGGVRSQSATSPTNPMGFQSQYRDSSTGNYNLRARMYDPGLGGFLQTDPIRSEPSYTYADGNPVRYSDPTGLFSICGGVACGKVWSEMWRNPVASWQAAPSWSKWVAGVSLVVAAAAGVTACALATVGICAGFTVFGLGNAAAGAGTGTALCEEYCDDAGSIVIGKYPSYLRLGEQLRADVFNVPAQKWLSMTADEQWATNKRFLDEALAAGSRIILATPPEHASSTYLMELEYLISKGATFMPVDYMQMTTGR